MRHLTYAEHRLLEAFCDAAAARGHTDIDDALLERGYGGGGGDYAEMAKKALSLVSMKGTRIKAAAQKVLAAKVAGIKAKTEGAKRVEQMRLQKADREEIEHFKGEVEDHVDAFKQQEDSAREKVKAIADGDERAGRIASLALAKADYIAGVEAAKYLEGEARKTAEDINKRRAAEIAKKEAEVRAAEEFSKASTELAAAEDKLEAAKDEVATALQAMKDADVSPSHDAIKKAMLKRSELAKELKDVREEKGIKVDAASEDDDDDAPAGYMPTKGHPRKRRGSAASRKMETEYVRKEIAIIQKLTAANYSVVEATRTAMKAAGKDSGKEDKE